MKFLKSIFKWNRYETVKAISGIFIFCLALNLFIVPSNLYNGGVMGLSQLARSFLVEHFDINVDFDIAGFIYFIMNVPLFILAYKKVSKGFIFRSLVIITLQTIFLTLIPIPDKPLVDNMFANLLIGAVFTGYGTGLYLSAGASGGGTEIIGTLLTPKIKSLSIGKIDIMFNIMVYVICGLLYGLETMIYSILYSLFANLMLDQTHEQNVCSQAFIFTKEDPHKIIGFIKDKLERDATYWEAKGGYDDSITYICYTVLSKYELLRLERNLASLNPNAFLAKSDFVGVHGDFKKIYNTFDKEK